MQYYSRWYNENCDAGFDAAIPGRSNHQGGRAIDVRHWSYWWDILLDHGFEHPIPTDNPHFELRSTAAYRAESEELKRLSITAFQRLWNRNNPDDLVAEDGVYGAATKTRLGWSPVEGFPIGACPPGSGGADPEPDTGAEDTGGDAGVHDAGTVDASDDAIPADATPADATTEDATTDEGGADTADAGTRDASTPGDTDPPDVDSSAAEDSSVADGPRDATTDGGSGVDSEGGAEGSDGAHPPVIHLYTLASDHPPARRGCAVSGSRTGTIGVVALLLCGVLRPRHRRPLENGAPPGSSPMRSPAPRRR